MHCCLAELNVTSGNFQFRIKNADNNAYTVDCVYTFNENYYDNSHVLTTTSPDYWSYTGSAWDLKYDRVDESHATGGRCETQSSGALQGTFSETFLRFNVLEYVLPFYEYRKWQIYGFLIYPQ